MRNAAINANADADALRTFSKYSDSLLYYFALAHMESSSLNETVAYWILFLVGLTSFSGLMYVHVRPLLAAWAQQVTRLPPRRDPPKSMRQKH